MNAKGIVLLDKRPAADVWIPCIDRPRLTSRLNALSEMPITVLAGPAGCGKSVAIKAALDDAQAIYFRVGNEQLTFARFVYGIAQAIAFVAPGAQASFPRAWERALQSHSASTALARWFCEHLEGIDRQIVIDDLHDPAEPGIASFIATVAQLRPKARLTIAVRSVGALPVALWMATRRMERPIDEAELNFNRAELLDAADDLDVALDSAGIDSVLAATGGSASAVAYVLNCLRRDSTAFSRQLMPASFEGIAQQIFGRRTDRERAFLLTASLFPSVDDDLLARSGWPDSSELRSALTEDAAFMWERDSHGGFRFHDRFCDYLGRALASREPDYRSALARQAVVALTAFGRYAAALELATRQQLIVAIGELLETRGFEILESGKVDVISEALEAFDRPDRSLGASALALRGYLEARSGRLDTAEAWFRLALEKAPDETTRVGIAMYYARELSLQRREDSGNVLEAFADSSTLSRAIAIDVQSSFAQALTAAGRLDEAAMRTDRALALLEPDLPPALRARVIARAAYVANESGAIELARERALIAAPLAVEQSLYDVAASTYSVLYSISHDIDDDATASLDYLRRVRDLGAKSGTLRLDLYALIGMYELQAEAGDEAALLELERDLSAVDKHYATAQIMEALLPAKALQAGWNGDFAAAQRLLRPIAERQATPARRALCWAQVALYCFAAGDAERADDAYRAAQDALSERDVTTHFGLTVLTLALASIVNGNIAETRKWTNCASNEALNNAPRLCALRDVVEALSAGSTNAQWYIRRVSSAIATLHDVSFGGMARLIEMLPLSLGGCNGEKDTLYRARAGDEFDRHFSAAVASDDAVALCAWLDTLRVSAFSDGVSMSERFERWTAARNDLDNRMQGPIRRVRKQLAAYRPRAAVCISVVDDIDASIDQIFESLDVAAPLMAEHSRAVSAWCSRLARVLGLTEAENEFVTRAGLIHDIGKMRTPPEILLAPRQLSAQEWAIMRDHAAEGGRIVERVPQLRVFTPIVRGHHERLDGEGYPDGLRGRAIPLAARIVSVADSFNAMIGRRPYRLPMAPTDALGELERHCGTQFDPEVVEAMVRIVLGRVSDAAAPSRDTTPAER